MFMNQFLIHTCVCTFTTTTTTNKQWLPCCTTKAHTDTQTNKNHNERGHKNLHISHFWCHSVRYVRIYPES